jgi:1,4-alpha-glucan branching enzyme
MILYELHVGTFSGEGSGAADHPGTFRQVVDRHLDHLVELGVNTVELLPVNEFAASLSWGYNPASQYAIANAYGSPDDLKEVTDTLSLKSIVTAEQLPNDPALTRSTDNGGAGLDSQWNDAFHDALRDALNAAAFGDPDMGRLAAGMNHFDFGGVRAINYIESHDEVAVHGRAVRAADGADPHSHWAYGRGKVAYGLVMLTAGMPMILQGQEFMEDRPFGDTTAHRIQWDYRDLYADYFLACRDLTWLRRRTPALRANAGQNIFHVNESANVVAWHRWNEPGQDLVIVACLNNNDLENYCLGMPLNGDWIELLNTDTAAYGGRNHGNGGSINANDSPPAFPAPLRLRHPAPHEPSGVR